ncbi:MAG TPA: hypothetical protein VF132_12310 [Rudaea sp.]
MNLIRHFALTFVLALLAACGSSQVSIQGHDLRLFAVDDPAVNWITQEDVDRVQRTSDDSGHALLRLTLKPEAATRMQTFTSANVGKLVRFTWDGKTIADMAVREPFGRTFELPAPPT